MVREGIHHEKGYTYGVEREFVFAGKSGISLLPYYEEGYDCDQLGGIRYALELGVDIEPYLDHGYKGACIKEIAIGLKKNLDVREYADLKYAWRKMREIRLGMERGLDISKYNDPMYSYWQMREIRLGLKAGLDVSSYANLMYTAKEMRKRRIMLKNRKNAPGLTGDWKILSGEDYDLCVSPDGVRAYFNWHCKRAIDGVDELEEILAKNDIVYGIDHKALQEIADEYQIITVDSEKDRNILVAKGKAPKDGRNGYYEWKFNLSRKRTPKLQSDGTIDFDDINWFDSVKKGQVLAKYHFAKPAIDGTNVFGKRISAKVGREKAALSGQGFELMPDFSTYVASVDGHVSLKNKELIVDELMTLDHLDSSTKSFHFDGDVYISGNIEGPVYIETGGDLVVDGFVQKAQIKCGGSLILKGGINNTAMQVGIVVGGQVISRFFECVTLNAMGNIYFGTSLNSNLSTYGEMVSYGRNGGIIGGKSYSEKGFCLTNIGNEAGVHTTLSLGSNEDIQTIYAKNKHKTIEIKDVLSHLVNVRNHMYSQRGIEGEPAGNILSKIEYTISEKNRELNGLNSELECIRKRERRACKSRIIVENQVFENVHVHYMNNKIAVVPSSQVEVYINGDGLTMGKLFDRGIQTA